MSTDKPNEVKRLEKLFEIAINAQRNTGSRNYKKECEEFYYNDVKRTRSQFDSMQKKKIRETYNIPVSTKMTFAINEQMLAFLTSNKPFARLLSVEESQKEWVYAMQKAYHCVWYESKLNRAINNVIRDSLGPGEGIIHVRPAFHEDEATTNVVAEYRNWKHFFVDPESRIWDYSDAEYMGLMDVMRIAKAEDRYDIKIPDTEKTADQGIPDVEDLANDFTVFGGKKKDDLTKYIWIKEFYEKKDKNVYLGTDIDTKGVIISTKRPDSIEIPNPEKMKLGQMLQNMKMQLQQDQQNLDTEVNTKNFSNEEGEYPVDQEEQTNQLQGDTMQNQNIMANVVKTEQALQSIAEMEQIYNEMEDVIPAFEMEIEGESKKPIKAISLNIVRSIKKRIHYTLMVGSQVVEKKILPIDRYPIVNFPFLHFGSPNRVFGNTHLIMDIVKAQNKYISEIMYDIAVNGHRKGFINEKSLVDPSRLEEDWPVPGKLIKTKSVPDDPDGGKPYILEPSPINQSITYMLDYYKQLIEYVTGIYGVMQGDTSQAPETFGATQSLQSFGTQRIKLYARNLENSMENLAYVIIAYIQAYAPRDKVLKYFDENGDEQEVKLMNSTEDLQFKVRVEMTSSLPTTRQLSMQLLAFITQTVSDDALKSLYTQYMLKMQDVPEADKMAEEIDIIRNLQSQLQQLQQQNEELQGQVSAAENNMQQMQVKNNVDNAANKATNSIMQSQMEIENEMENTPIPKELMETNINNLITTEEEV